MKKYLIIILFILFINTNNYGFTVKSKELIYLTVINKPAIVRQVFISANKYQIEPELVLALIYAESAFNPKARSKDNHGDYSRGLMQLNQRYYKFNRINDFYDIKINIDEGTKFLKWCLEKSDGNIVMALAYYNCGITNVKNGKVWPMTLTYIDKILKYQNYLEAIYSLNK